MGKGPTTLTASQLTVPIPVLGLGAHRKMGQRRRRSPSLSTCFRARSRNCPAALPPTELHFLTGLQEGQRSGGRSWHRTAFQAQLQDVVEIRTSDRHANLASARRGAERAPARLFLQPGLSLFPRRIRFPRKSAGRGSINLNIRNYFRQNTFIPFLTGTVELDAASHLVFDPKNHP